MHTSKCDVGSRKRLQRKDSQELRRFVPSSLCKVSDGALRLGANVTSGRCDVITRGVCWLTFYRVRLRHERLGYRFSSIRFVLHL